MNSHSAALSRFRRLLCICACFALVFAIGRDARAAQTGLRSGSVVTANEKGRSISIVDPARWNVVTLPLPVAPHNVQTSADRRYLFVTGMENMDEDMPEMSSGYLLEFDVLHLDRPIFSLQVGRHPAHVVVDRANRYAYVTVSGDNVVKMIDVRKKSVIAEISVGRMPHGLRMSPDEQRMYVCNMGESSVSFIDVARRKEIGRVQVGAQPVQVAVAPDGTVLYVTLARENAVSVVDTVLRRVVGHIKVGSNPAQLFVSPDGHHVYVANQGTPAAPGDSLSVIDTSTRSVVATVTVGRGAHGVVVTPDGSRVYVTDAFDSTLSAVDARTYRVRSINVGKGPNGVTLAL